MQEAQFSQPKTDKKPLCPGWMQALGNTFDSQNMTNLRSFLKSEVQKGKVIYPASDEVFAALNLTPFEDVKVVILGQDPYHGPGQAHGLSFSVKPGVPPPPSLQNIYKELASDLGCSHPGHGYLKHWADQGVLLLNSVLTVERSKAGSHGGKGWETFTDEIVQALSDQRENVAFLLWGAYAQKKGKNIDRKRHLVLQSPHPSPLSAHRGFFGSAPFSKINQYLESKNSPPIDWQLPVEN